jgi:hypothetical protein
VRARSFLSKDKLGLPPRSGSREQTLLLATVALFLLLVSAYSFSVGLRATRAASISGDEPFYLLTTQSLLEDGDLDLRQQYEKESFRSFFDHPDGLWKQSIANKRGEILSPHEPGLAVLVIPGFAIDGLRAAQIQLLLIGALSFSLAFVFTALETRALLASWIATAIVGLSATAFVYSTEVYPELPASLCLVSALLLLRKQRGGVVDGLVLALLLTGLLWLGMKYAALGSLVAAYFLLKANASGRFAFLVPSGASACFYVWFHFAVFGDLTAYSINTVYEGAPAGEVLKSHLAFSDRIYRLWGLFIDERFGIGRWAPVLLLVPPSLPLLLQRGRMGGLILGLILSQVLVATFVAITMMGWWFPGRTLVVVLPLFAFALTLLLKQLRWAGRAFVGALGLCSLVSTVLLFDAASRVEVLLAVNPFDIHSPLFRTSRLLFPDYRSWGTETVALTVTWLCLGIAVCGWLNWKSVASLRWSRVRRFPRNAVKAEVA